MEIIQTFVSLFVLGVLGIIILIFDHLATPHRRGYFNRDQSLSYPYHGSTVKAVWLHIVGILVPFCLIFLHHFLKNGRKWKVPKRSQWKESFVILALPTFIGYLFGAGATEVVTMIGKYSVGRLRPHFFEVCQPDPESGYVSNSQFTSGDQYNYGYDCKGNADQFPDLNERNKRIKEVSLSFPSGHASFAFQAATFTVLYLQAKFSQNPFARKSLLVPFFQVLVIAGAFYTGVSRVIDYKHHPTDVIAGGLIGTLIQILNCFSATLIFSREDESPRSQQNEEESISLRTKNQNETKKTQSE